MNESGYLIFYPNLTRAYALVKEANTIASSNNTTQVFSLLQEARASAQDQENAIAANKTYAALVMIALVAAASYIMYFVMRPRVAAQKRR